MIEPGAKVLDDGSVIAAMKYVDKFAEFSSNPEEQSGHYFPFSLGSAYSGKKIKVQRIAPTVGTETESNDLDWVFKVEKDKKFSIKADDKPVITLNFRQSTTETPPTGESAFQKDKTNYGRFGKNEAYYKTGKVDIAWDGTAATVTGELNWMDTEARGSYSELKTDGNYFAFALGDWFKGKEITVDNGGKVNKATDTDWVCLVKEANKTITVKCGEYLIATFDLSKATLASAGEP